ncbi:MAG: type II toxin-antitoxin system HicA family toxin [Chloroflexi bacterium]|nr:type II toxin-antitoxin system HicA family toxin [Chloroflexota bacterium]
MVSRSLRNVRQEEAVRAFVRLGGIERRGKGSHRVVNINGRNLSIPHGILKVGLLTSLIKMAGVSTEEFLDAL